MNASASTPLVRWSRVPLLFLGIAALVIAVFGGLARLPVGLPLVRADWVLLHGPLMVCAFLGTVVSLERAVGLPDRWPYAATIIIGAAGLHFIAGGPINYGVRQLVFGSALFFAVTLRVIRLRYELFTLIMSLGALTWLVGNVLWLAGRPFPQIVPWWIAFLGLTIVGERIDLSRFQKPAPLARPLFLAAVGIFLTGVTLTSFHELRGQQLLGGGLIALAAWLARHDLARRTVHQAGLPRFMALSLLGGFAWLAVSGVLFLGFAPLAAGFAYDAALHAFFVGFVFSMIFGHAPVIFPSVLGLTAIWRSRFYAHLLLLHVSLALRIGGDLGESVLLRQWGGGFNAVAMGLFLLNTVTALVGNQRNHRLRQAGAPAASLLGSVTKRIVHS
jgi:hypothetical protein